MTSRQKQDLAAAIAHLECTMRITTLRREAANENERARDDSKRELRKEAV